MRDWEIVTSITSTGRPEHTVRVLSMCVHRTTGRDVPQPGVSAANGKAAFSEYQESERQEGEDSSSPKGVSSSSPASRGSRSPIRGDRPRIKGSGKKFCRSSEAITMARTALLCVEELNTRSREPFSTSYDELHTYGTTVHMSILSSRFMRCVQIMPTSRVARAPGSQCHHTHSTDPYRARGIRNGNTSNHDDPWLTARMRPAGRWAANRHKSRARRRVTISSFWLVSTLSAAALACIGSFRFHGISLKE